MPAQPTRRAVVLGALAITAFPISQSRALTTGDIEAGLAEIEAGVKGRLGVAILDTKTGRFFGQRELERFPLCSTFKVFAAALVLDRVDRGEEKLDRRVVIAKDDIVANSPVTQDHVGGDGMTIGELCAAAITRSDNTAANILLASFGGPEVLTKYLRTLGDKATRLDRTEPALNDVPAGDFRDGTTPRAMAYLLQHILLGNVLSKTSQTQLTDWMVANKTGDARFRAGLPSDWKVADKTGTCSGAASDIAVIWPPARAPIVLIAYLADTPVPIEAREKALADVARLAAKLV
jgi:beta-lactamase class A